MLEHRDHWITKVETDIGIGFMGFCSLSVLGNATIGNESININGHSFDTNPLSAAIAAQGEALERLIFLYGPHFTTFAFAKADCTPADYELLNAPYDRNIGYEPCYRLSFSSSGKSMVPRRCLHSDPLIASPQNRVYCSTGWAYHTDRPLALRKALHETIERDIVTRFWYLDHLFGSPVEQSELPFNNSSGHLMPRPHSEGFAVEIDLPPPLNGTFWVCVLGVTGDHQPFLTAGSGTGLTRKQAVAKAWSELLHLRHYQCERLAAGLIASNPRAYDYGTDYAAVNRDQAEIFSSKVAGPNGSKHLSYADRTVGSVEIDAGSVGAPGYVAKAWCEGCRPLVPSGTPCLSPTVWREEFKAPLQFGEAYAHPFP